MMLDQITDVYDQCTECRIDSTQLKQIESNVRNNPKTVLEQDCLNLACTVVKNVGDDKRIRVVELLVDGLENSQHSVALIKCYLFLIYQALNLPKRIPKDQGQSLTLLTKILWNLNMDHDKDMHKLVLNLVLVIAETGIKNLELQLHDIFSLVCKHSVPLVGSMIMNRLCLVEESDHLICMVVGTANDDVTEQILRSVGEADIQTGNAVLAKNCSTLLVLLSEKNPRMLLRNISQLGHLLEHEIYSLRMCMIEAIGHLIVYSVGQQESPSETQIQSLFRGIKERFRDVNSFVRNRVLQTVLHLCNNGAVPIAQRYELVSLAIDRLHDKSSNVRKRAVQLLGGFISKHPFSLDGGELDIEMFRKQLQKWNQFESEEARLKQRYYQEGIEFIEQIHKTFATMNQLMVSPNKHEAIEAIDFVLLANVYKIRGSEQGMRSMIHLVWKKETGSANEECKKSIREAVALVYKRLYLEGNAQWSDITQRLIDLVQTLSCSELVSLCEIFQHWLSKSLVDDQILEISWAKFKNPNESPENRRSSLILISFYPSNCIEREVNVLVSNGFPDIVYKDPAISERLLHIIQKTRQDALDSPLLNRIFQLVIVHCQNEKWLKVAQQAVSTIYRCVDSPDMACGNLIQQLTATMADQQRINEFDLAKVVLIGGHVSINQVMYLERIEALLKAQLRDEQNRHKLPYENEETLCRTIEHVRDHELLYGDNSLLASIARLTISICSGKAGVDGPLAKRIAALALSKFMCVSAVFCKTHMDLFQNLMADAEDKILRSNMIVAFGDIAAIHGGLVDQYIGQLFLGLDDSHPGIKKNSVLVAIRLILNGAIKARGYMGKMVRLIDDPDDEISDLVRVFIRELGAKDSSYMYNHFLDIVSVLLDMGVEQERFRRMIRYVLEFITRERHLESLVDRLCQRLQKSESGQGVQELIFCITQLVRNEKPIAKLQQNLDQCRHIIQDDLAHQSLQEMVSRVRKGMRTDSKGAVENFEGFLRQIRDEARGQK